MIRETQIANQQEKGGHPFPVVMLCNRPDCDLDDASQWVASRKETLSQRVRECGAILFRGLPISTAEDFDRFVEAFGFNNFEYKKSLSNAVRTNFTPRVFSANEAPAEVTIFLHHEMAQTPVFPSKLFFFCQKAAEFGGATPLCRSDWLFEDIQNRLPEFAHACEEKGLKYTTIMPGKDDPASGMGRSWQSTFQADDRSAVENKLTELNYSWEWLSDGCLKAMTPVLPAVHQLQDGRRVFFNQLIAAFQGWKDARNDPSKAITFGDESPLNRHTMKEVARMAEELTFDLNWQSTDVALIDNYVAMHGRRTFTGTRKVLASLADAETHSRV